MYQQLNTLALTLWLDTRRRLASSRGQGTVEYVGIVLVIGALLIALKSGVAGDNGSGIAAKLTKAVSGAIDTVMKDKS